MPKPQDVIVGYEPSEDAIVNAPDADLRWKLCSSQGNNAEFQLEYNGTPKALVVKATNEGVPIVGYAMLHRNEDPHLFIVAHGDRAGFGALFYYMRLVEFYVYDNNLVIPGQ